MRGAAWRSTRSPRPGPQPPLCVSNYFRIVSNCFGFFSRVQLNRWRPRVQVLAASGATLPPPPPPPSSSASTATFGSALLSGAAPQWFNTCVRDLRWWKQPTRVRKGYGFQVLPARGLPAEPSNPVSIKRSSAARVFKSQSLNDAFKETPLLFFSQGCSLKAANFLILVWVSREKKLSCFH